MGNGLPSLCVTEKSVKLPPSLPGRIRTLMVGKANEDEQVSTALIAINTKITTAQNSSRFSESVAAETQAHLS
jgi:hypothetical protein